MLDKVIEQSYFGFLIIVAVVVFVGFMLAIGSIFGRPISPTDFLLAFLRGVGLLVVFLCSCWLIGYVAKLVMKHKR